MSTTARKARKRAGVPFTKAAKVPTARELSEAEFKQVVRFGFDCPPGTQWVEETPALLAHQRRMRLGFAIVLGTLAVVVAVVLSVVFL